MVGQIFEVMGAVVPVHLCILLGFCLRRWGGISKEVDDGVTKLLVNALVPCLIVSKLLGSDVASDLLRASQMVLLGVGTIIMGVSLTYVLSPLAGLQKGKGRNSFAMATGLQNFGYIAIPLMIALFPSDEALAHLFLYNLGVEVAMWSLGIMLFTGVFKLRKEVFLKGPVLAVFIGIGLNVTGMGAQLPSVLVETVDRLGSIAITLALLIVGMTLAEIVPITKFSWKISSTAVLFRCFLVPATFLAVAYIFPFSDVVRQVLLVQSAMPGAFFPIVLARHYGGHPELVAEVAIVTNILSVFMVPLIIVQGAKLLFGL